MTPYLVYMSEFSLMLRIGSNKETLDKFTTSTFLKFPALQQIPITQVVQPEISKKDKKSKPPLMPVVEIQDEDDDGEDVELSFGERLFLAVYA